MSHQNDARNRVDLAAIFGWGLPSFYRWIRTQARKTIPPVMFREGHLAANPVACYVNAQMGNPRHQAHLYEGMLYTISGAQAVPEDFQQFLWDFHDAFPEQHVTAHVLSEWIAQGRPRPYRFDDSPNQSQCLPEQIGHCMERVVTLVRASRFYDPLQPTYEECLGIALATYCSWEGPSIARTCLRLCYIALQEANYATLERLLREHFGEETFS